MATKRFVSKDNLGRVWMRLFGKVLNSKEEIEANTSENMIAGADAVKEVYSSLVSDIYVGSDGKLHKTKGGADTVLNFSSEPLETYISNSAYGSVACLIKNNGDTLMSGNFSGDYFSVRSVNSYWNLTAKKNCKISYVSMNKNSTTHKSEIKTVKVGDIISQSGYDGIMVVKVLE